MKAVCETPSKRRTAMNTPSIRKFRASLVATILAVASLSSTSHAQVGGVQVRVEVPFAFVCGSHHFAAGIYAIRMENQHVTLTQGSSGSGRALTELVSDLQPAKKGKAVFQRYGDQYFLQEVWSPGMTSHIHYVRSKAQKQPELASIGTGSADLELALLEKPR
jgi:hypothetical protein